HLAADFETRGAHRLDEERPLRARGLHLLRERVLRRTHAGSLVADLRLRFGVRLALVGCECERTTSRTNLGEETEVRFSVALGNLAQVLHDSVQALGLDGLEAGL